MWCIAYQEDDMKMQNYQESDMSASFHVQVQLEGVGWFHFCKNMFNLISDVWQLQESQLVFKVFIPCLCGFSNILPLFLGGGVGWGKASEKLTIWAWRLCYQQCWQCSANNLWSEPNLIISLTSQAQSIIQATAGEQNLHASNSHANLGKICRNLVCITI